MTDSRDVRDNLAKAIRGCRQLRDDLRREVAHADTLSSALMLSHHADRWADKARRLRDALR